MTRTAIRIRFHHSRLTWQLAALLCLPSIPLAQSPPATPSSVTVTRSDGALTATWPAISGATTYHVTYSTDNRQSWSLAALSHTTNSITISGDNAKTYVVGVRAGNDDGRSGWQDSPPAGPYTSPNANPPGPVASVSLTRADAAATGRAHGADRRRRRPERDAGLERPVGRVDYRVRVRGPAGRP